MLHPKQSAVVMQPKSPEEIKQHLANTFPTTGKVRAKQIAPYLGIGISTWWLYQNQGRVKPPMRYGARVSVWDAEYIRELAANGIPEKEVV